MSYSKEMRERAKSDGKTLGTVDIEHKGTRYESQGPMNEDQSRFLLWAAVLVGTWEEGDKLPDLRATARRRDKKRKERGA